MRFSIGDLLLVSSLVAFYSGCMALLPSAPAFLSPWVSAAIMAVMPAWVIGQSVISQRRLGGTIVAWRVRNWWIPHAMMAMFFAVCVVLAVIRDQNSPTIWMQFVAYHVLFFAMTSATLGEEGLLVGESLLRWRDHTFELHEDVCLIRYQRRPHAKSVWGIEASEVRFPESKLDRIRAAFAARPHWTREPSRTESA